MLIVREIECIVAKMVYGKAYKKKYGKGFLQFWVYYNSKSIKIQFIKPLMLKLVERIFPQIILNPNYHSLI
tara:strand:- start:768 stop:980 length:213 start_codon:yes stop_codon:yes gene_type:complete